jgi:hypothetical protein
MSAIQRPLPTLDIPRPKSIIENPFSGELLEREARWQGSFVMVSLHELICQLKVNVR